LAVDTSAASSPDQPSQAGKVTELVLKSLNVASAAVMGGGKMANM
jgi:hypothetical protein